MQIAGRRARGCPPSPADATTSLLVLVLAMVWFSTALSEESSKDPEAVRVRRITRPGYVSLVVENRRAYEVTVMLRITAENVQITRIIPETGAYSGHSQIEAARIAPADPTKPWKWRYRFKWTKGSIYAEHDAGTLYLLPFTAGTSCRVSQGYNGRLTHHDRDRYAVDFAMPEGTTVCAAREGIVVDLCESSKTGGPHRKYRNTSNYVSIAHTDGTIGEYHHLQHDGVLVEIGDRVAAGQPIGLSGDTGYSTLPHLHFGVYSAVDAEHLQSHPITFDTRQGLVAEPCEGRAYTAQ